LSLISAAAFAQMRVELLRKAFRCEGKHETIRIAPAISWRELAKMADKRL